MTTLPPVESTATRIDAWEGGAQEPEFKPLTREEAQQWRSKQPTYSIGRVVGLQCLVGIAVALLAWALMQSSSVGWSVFYGAASVTAPTALMAYGITSSALARLTSGFAHAAFLGLLFWEGVKVVLAVAMLWLAPTAVPELNWLGLLLGLVVVLKVYWWGFWAQSYRHQKNG